MSVAIVCRGGEKFEFAPASSQLLFTPTSVEVVVDSGNLSLVHLTLDMLWHLINCRIIVVIIVLLFCKFFLLCYSCTVPVTSVYAW